MHARTLSLALASAALLGPAVAGCADTPDATGTTPRTSTPTEQVSTEAPEPTPTTSTPSEPASPAALTDRLLATARVPGLNAQWRWQDGETGPATTDPFGVCAKADLLSIGATDAVARTYFPPDDSDDSAAEQVAEFPDAKTAATAWTVLGAWHDRCGRAMDASAGLKVGPMAPVSVGTGSARWYLLSWRPAGEETGRFESFGMVLAGTRIAVLRIDHSGQDHSYPTGKDPIAGMAAAASDLLG